MGYRYAEIKKRIQLQEKHRQMPPIVKAVKKGKLCSRLQSRYQIRKVKKLYRIRYFHYLNPYAVNQSAIRKQLLHIHFLSAEVGVMLKYGIRSVEDAEAVYQELRLENRQSGKSGLGSEELAVRQKYQALRKQVEKKTMDDHQMEMILDQMEELERQYPGGLLMAQERETKENPDVKVLRRMVRKERKEQEAALEMQKKGAACPRKNQHQEDTLIEQVLQCQFVIARNIGLDRDVVSFLESITDWKKREWYYLAALDGMSCKDLQEMEQKDMSTSQIRKERLFYLKNLYTDHDELGEEVLKLKNEITDTRKQSEQLRTLVEENLETAFKREAESYKHLIEEKEKRIQFLEEELKHQKKREQAVSLTRGAKKQFWYRKRKKELEGLLTNEKMSDEQKDFLIDCLEEGLTPKQIMEFADPNFSVNVMRRLKQLQQRGGLHGVLEELADKYGGLISDLRFDYKRREAAMMDLLAMQLQKNSTVDREQREAMLYLFGFPWRKEGNCIGVENFEGILAQMTVIGYSDKEACAYLIDEEGAYYRWSCPKTAVWKGCSVSMHPEMEKITDPVRCRQCERMMENGEKGTGMESGV